MPSPQHEAYRKSVVEGCARFWGDSNFEAQLEARAVEAALLWELDLEPARSVLAACYARHARGAKPRDAVVMLRCLLLSLLAGQPSLNRWVRELRASVVLRILAGLGADAEAPGVGTFYDFLHRLHDGPRRGCCAHAPRPSAEERRRAASPRKGRQRPEVVPGRRAKKNGKQARRSEQAKQAEAAAQEQRARTVTAQLTAELEKARHLDNPADLLGRLSAILLNVAVAPSAKRGLLGDTANLVLGGDGSPLTTGANRHGLRSCDHPFTARCGCERRYTDPDADWGWDNHRDRWFFGHHFYEVSCSVAGHDLPLTLRLDPGQTSDFTASLRALDHLTKNLRAHGLDWRIGHFIADAGHDAEPLHRHLHKQGIRPIIPLKAAARATHPTRPEVLLSARGVPLCEAGIEMAHWGSAGKGRTNFICPLRAGKVSACPKAPGDKPDWHCRPDLKAGPTRAIPVTDNPRLFPAVPRNSATYERLYPLRSGTERSNSVKKVAFQLEGARHRRASFWLIRLHLIAILQHARAWVTKDRVAGFVDELWRRAQPPTAAAA